MTRTAALFLCALALAGVADSPAEAQPAASPAPHGELPRGAYPTRYAITVSPDAAQLTFTGTESIELTLTAPSREVTLNAHKLVIERAVLASANGATPIPLVVTLDEAREQVRFTAPAMLGAGSYRLELAYRGTINRQPSGLFALDYPDKRTGATVRGLFTQFEVQDAREFAPLFDEPAYKATFEVAAVVPASQLAVGNMPVVRTELLGGGRKRVTFAATPRMSSYLLFFAVGDFERQVKAAADGTEVGIVAPRGSGETARYALDATAALLPFYNDYFGVRYPLPKLDNVAAPGQSQTFGAMENWGGILTFEQNLLLDPRNTAPDRVQYLYTALAHETAHQWFGNLVTMAWWDDLWLNEGFASWFETKATDHFHPDWHALVSRVGGRERAMALDSLPSTHPIVAHLRTAAEADQVFDQISYSKGEAIIAMLESFAGEEVWRDGVRRYLTRHAYGSAVTSDLWRAQEAAGAKDIASIADTFTRQAGVPLVSVSQRCTRGQNRLTLTQGQFSRDQRQASGRGPLRWRVPLTILAGDGSVHRMLLDGAAETTVPGCGPALVNGGQLGYFRTLYRPAELARFRTGLGALAPIDQLGLVQDNLALAAAGYQAYAPALDLLRAVPPDANPVVAKGAVGAWSSLYSDVGEPSDRAMLAGLVQRQWAGRLDQLGFAPVPGESVADTDLRATLIDTLGRMADPGVVAQARTRLAMLKSDRTSLDGPLKSTWLGIVSRNASADDWDLLRKLGRNAPSEVEKANYFTALGAAIDDTLAQRALDLALTEEPGATTGAAILTSVAAYHPDLAFDFAIAHDTRINALVDDYSRANFIPELLKTSTNPAMIAKLLALRDARRDTERKAADEQLAALRARLAAGPRIRAQLAGWIRSQRR
ncbi:MAG: M1 family aminopeptidase [Croceibacterium sp.]